MHFLVLQLLFKIVQSFVCSSCHYLNYLKKLYLYMSLFFTVAILKMEEICCCCSTLHISSSRSDCSAGLFSPHSGKPSCGIFFNAKKCAWKTKAYAFSCEVSLEFKWFVVSIIFLTVCPCKSTRPLFSEDQQLLRGH